MEQQCGEAKDIPISIRPYAPGDLAACRALWAELTEWHRYIYESPGNGAPDPGSHFDEHLNRVGAENIWVAEAGERIAGVVGLIPGEGEAELEPLVVREAYRGMGIGRRLAETVIAVARVLELRLWILKSRDHNDAL